MDKAIYLALENIFQILKSINYKYEVIVVNDGSTDHTLDIIKEFGSKNPDLKIISYSQNKGKGYAVRTGIMQSYGKFVMFVDGDLDISASSIKECILHLNNYDLIIGSKLHSLSEIDAVFSRKFLSRAFSVVVRLLTSLKIKDTQVGLKVGDGEKMRKIFRIMSTNGFSFDVEFLVIASLLNLKIKEMPVKMKLTRRFRFTHSVKMFEEVLMITFRYRILHYYQKRLNLK